MYDKKRGNCVEEGSNLICMNKVGVIAYEIVKYHMYKKVGVILWRRVKSQMYGKSRGNCVEEC